MTSKTTYHMTYIALFTIFIVICSWITVPMVIPFTMQTFAIFFTVAMLGGKLGTCTVLVYVLLGLIGIPVFHGFQGGIGILFSNTGGYIIGFIFSALLMWGIERLFGDCTKVLAISMLLGMLTCYVFGTAWFMLLYTGATGPISLMTALGWCVIPFIIPDLIKIGLALGLSNYMSKSLKLKI